MARWLLCVSANIIPGNVRYSCSVDSINWTLRRSLLTADGNAKMFTLRFSHGQLFHGLCYMELLALVPYRVY